MGGFSIDKYNQLLDIEDAHTRFQEQLASAGITQSQLFLQLESLFLEGEVASCYSLWLVHHHFDLEDGERMVSYGNLSKPTRDTSSNIIPECWIGTGEEVEHRFVESNSDSLVTQIPPPPPVEFFTKFKAIVDSYGIDSLGICYAPDINELGPGFVFLETLMPETREQVVNIVPKSMTGPGKTVTAAWDLSAGSCTKGTVECAKSCVDCKGKKSTLLQ